MMKCHHQIASWQEKKTVSILYDEFCEEQSFPYLLPKGKFGYKVLFGTLIKSCSTLHQIQIIYFLPGLYIYTIYIYQ